MHIAPALAAMPPPGDRRLAVRITPDALRQVRNGHPWVYDESIVSISHDGAPGDLAVVFDARRRFAAIGLYDPDSPIRVRILHAGDPIPIDRSWWDATISTALGRRAVFTADPLADRLGYRVVNGENDGCSGLVVDRYADVLVVEAFSAAWFPHLAQLVAVLVERTDVAGVVLRLGRRLRRRHHTFGLADGDVVAGEVGPGPVRFLERRVGRPVGAALAADVEPLAFDVDVRRGQKTGHFLDQRHNRRQVGALASGTRVLDVFAATGGFGLHAAAGGATSVHAVDRSAPTLAAAERNVAINRHLGSVASCRFTHEVGDAFTVLARLAADGAQYDLVVVDPPSFASSAADVDAAVAAYGRLTALALGVLADGGVLVQASCTSRVSAEVFVATVTRSAYRAGRRLVEIARTGHDVDHPVTFAEGAYLKAGFWRLG